MVVEKDIKEMFSYSINHILISIFVILLLIIIFLIIKKKNTKKGEIKIIKTSLSDSISIKDNYLKQINDLEINIKNNKISEKQAYQCLSILIRKFVFEQTHIKVQFYTLSEIEKLNIPVLFELVKEYYEPEFSANSKGNIINSLMKTKAVIEKWN